MKEVRVVGQKFQIGQIKLKMTRKSLSWSLMLFAKNII